MSLYVKVFCGFYRHRKTMRLRAMLGDDALWIPPALWAYAAENQPDGDFSSYEPGEIALSIGYNKDALSMLEALHSAGFMDETNRIHDWQEHNSYHETYANRAKAAAAARWKNKKEKTPKTKDKDSDKDKELIRRQALLEACNKHACSIIEFLNAETGRRFRAEGDTLKAFAARAGSVEYDFEGIKKMVTRQIARWKGTEQEEYLRPSTLFRKSKFDEYYAAKDCPIPTDKKQNRAESREMFEEIKVPML